MDKIKQQFKDEAKSVHLVARERDSIREAILGNEVEKLVPAQPSPFSFLLNPQWNRLVPIAAIFLFIIAGVPITNAAQQSVPGDFLYIFEVAVVEEIELHLHFTAESKNEYHLERLHERLDEIHTIREKSDVLNDYAPVVVREVAEHTEEVLRFGEMQDSKSDVDELVELSALVEAHETFYERVIPDGGEAFAGVSDRVSQEIVLEVDAYVAENNSETVLMEISADIDEISLDQDARQSSPLESFIDARLTEVAEEITTKDLGGALLVTSDIRIELLKRDLLQRENGS